jgi:aminoglycoside phosphotransferase (APT) family kinase protein
VTAYLAERFPHDPAIRCTQLAVLPGGRSKRTILLEVEGATSLPRHLVMRQDGAAGIDTSVVDEARALESAAGHQLPIPEVLLREDRPTALGKAFMLMNRLPGVQAGSYFGFAPPDPALAVKAATLLAKLHQIDPAGTPLTHHAQPGAKATILAELALQEKKWRAEAVEPSPIMEHGLHWVRNNLHRIPDAAGLVHGDYRPHNFLVEGGEITGLLDWEFTHIGDPAEDLAYIRPTITPFMPWADFMAAYVAAGGQAHEEGTLLFYEVWNMVRLTAGGVAGTSRFLHHATDDLCDGIGGYFILPIHESIISRGIRAAERAWAEAPIIGAHER